MRLEHSKCFSIAYSDTSIALQVRSDLANKQTPPVHELDLKNPDIKE